MFGRKAAQAQCRGLSPAKLATFTGAPAPKSACAIPANVVKCSGVLPLAVEQPIHSKLAVGRARDVQQRLTFAVGSISHFPVPTAKHDMIPLVCHQEMQWSQPRRVRDVLIPSARK